MRTLGGQIGVAAMTRFIAVREQFHSNMLGLYIQRGSWLTDQRVRMLAGGVLPRSTDGLQAHHRAATILGLQVRAQAYTLATSDGFVLIVWVVIVYLLLMLLLKPGKITFSDLSKMKRTELPCRSFPMAPPIKRAKAQSRGPFRLVCSLKRSQPHPRRIF